MRGYHRPVSAVGHAVLAVAVSLCFAPLLAIHPQNPQTPDRTIVYPTLGHTDVGSAFLPQLGLRLVGTTTLLQTDESPRVAALDPTGRFAFVGTRDSQNTRATIFKVALGDGDELPTVVGEIDITPLIPSACFMDTGGETAWFMVNDYDPANPKFNMLQVAIGEDADPPLIVDEFEIRDPSRKNSAAWAEADPQGGYCFLGVNDSVHFKLNPDGQPVNVQTMSIEPGEASPSRVHFVNVPDRIMNFRGPSLLDPASRMIYAVTNGGEDGVRNLLKLKLEGSIDGVAPVGYVDFETGVAIVTSLVFDPATNRVHAGVRYVGYGGFGGVASFDAGAPNALPSLLGYTPFDHKIHFGEMLGNDSLQLLLSSIEPSPDSNVQDGYFIRADMNAETFRPHSLQKLGIGQASDFFGMADANVTGRAYSFSSDPLRVTEVDLSETYDILHATKIEVNDLPIIPKEMQFFSNAGAGNLRLGIYSGEETKTLVWQSEPIILSEPGANIVVPIASGTPPSLVLGRGDHWLVWQSDAQECVGSSSERIYDGAGFYVYSEFGAFPESISPAETTSADWRWTQSIRYVPTSAVYGSWVAYE